MRAKVLLDGVLVLEQSPEKKPKIQKELKLVPGKVYKIDADLVLVYSPRRDRTLRLFIQQVDGKLRSLPREWLSLPSNWFKRAQARKLVSLEGK